MLCFSSIDQVSSFRVADHTERSLQPCAPPVITIDFSELFGEQAFLRANAPKLRASDNNDVEVEKQIAQAHGNRKQSHSGKKIDGMANPGVEAARYETLSLGSKSKRRSEIELGYKP